MTAVRDAIGLLRLGAVAGLATREERKAALRVPESVASAKNDDERWDLRTAGWLERIGKIYPLRKDSRRVFITRKGRKVGLYAEPEMNGNWTFEPKDQSLNVLVLLAEDQEGVLHDYVLPPKVLQDCWKKFEREHGAGHTTVVINVQKTADGPRLIVPNSENIEIQKYEGDYSALQ
jgi:hypothetical protein